MEKDVRRTSALSELDTIIVPSNHTITKISPVKLLKIGQNYNLFGGLGQLENGKVIWKRSLGTVSKKVQAYMVERGFGTKNKSLPPSKEQPFVLALAQKYREKIWRLLDEKTKATMRLVSQSFKNEIDLFAGLEVIVNDEDEGNIEFVESVETIEACVVHLKNSYFKNHKKLFRCNWNIDAIDSWMQLNTVTFRHLILDCSQTLQCIYFREMALLKKYVSSSKAEESNTYTFPSLTTIMVYYGYFDNPNQNFKIFNSNMRFILSTFDCPKLTNLQVLPEPSVLDELLHGKKTIIQDSCRWESHPLKHFVSKHRNNLEKLKLVLYRTHLTPERENYIPPTNLIEYLILFPMLEAAQLKNFRNYWRTILQSQLELQVVSSQAELWGDFDSLSKSLRRNLFIFSASSLTKIYLESYHRKPKDEPERTHTLDLRQFGTFGNLKELHLTVAEIGKKSDTFELNQLSSLPRKMEVLIIEGFLCLSTELVHVSTLRNLRRVTIKRCGSDGNYGVTFQVARAFLIHKSIQVVEFGGFNEKNDTRLLYALIKKFNMGKFENEFEVVNPRDRISFIDWFPCCCCMKPHGEENINIH